MQAGDESARQVLHRLHQVLTLLTPQHLLLRSGMVSDDLLAYVAIIEARWPYRDEVAATHTMPGGLFLGSIPFFLTLQSCSMQLLYGS